MKELNLDKLHALIVNKLSRGDMSGIMSMIDPKKVGGEEEVKKIGESLKEFMNLKPKVKPPDHENWVIVETKHPLGKVILNGKYVKDKWVDYDNNVLDVISWEEFD